MNITNMLLQDILFGGTSAGETGGNAPVTQKWEGTLAVGASEIVDLVGLPDSNTLEYQFVIGGVLQEPREDFSIDHTTNTLRLTENTLTEDTDYFLIYRSVAIPGIKDIENETEENKKQLEDCFRLGFTYGGVLARQTEVEKDKVYTAYTFNTYYGTAVLCNATKAWTLGEQEPDSSFEELTGKSLRDKIQDSQIDIIVEMDGSDTIRTDYPAGFSRENAQILGVCGWHTDESITDITRDLSIKFWSSDFSIASIPSEIYTATQNKRRITLSKRIEL